MIMKIEVRHSQHLQPLMFLKPVTANVFTTPAGAMTHTAHGITEVSQQEQANHQKAKEKPKAKISKETSSSKTGREHPVPQAGCKAKKAKEKAKEKEKKKENQKEKAKVRAVERMATINAPNR